MTWTQRNSYEISSEVNNIEKILDSIREVLSSKESEGWSGYISVDIMEDPKYQSVYDLTNPNIGRFFNSSR